MWHKLKQECQKSEKKATSISTGGLLINILELIRNNSLIETARATQMQLVLDFQA